MKSVEYYLNLPYEIIIRKLTADEGGGYFASYKDFPGVMGDGESEAEAIADVKSAFSGVIELMLQKGEFIKEPSFNDKNVRVNVNLPRRLLDAIDKISKNRSEFLRQAAEMKLINA